MSFDLDQAIAVLRRTPGTLEHWLRGLPEAWTRCDEGPDTWSAFDVLGHLVHGERTDWIPRARIILEEGEARAFEPFDRFAQLRENRGVALDELLDRFACLRRGNLATLQGWDLGAEDFQRRGTHPELGSVTLGELLATWVVHDLTHLRQIARVMARRWEDAIGPWKEFVPVPKR